MSETDSSYWLIECAVPVSRVIPSIINHITSIFDERIQDFDI
jgi:hypothetical protein